MIFYMHFILLTSGLSGTSVLLGVYLQTYSDASRAEVGYLLMSFPFVCLFVKPLFCSLADKYQAHKSYLAMSMVVMLLGFSPFLIIPFLTSFHTHHKRFCWWLFFCSGQIGNCGLGVAWSLGDSLAVNYAHRKGLVYSRLRLMGTLSWGIYGYIIGLINEIPSLPKYVPSFLTMYVSVMIQIIAVILWNDDDFKMSDVSEGTSNDDNLARVTTNKQDNLSNDNRKSIDNCNSNNNNDCICDKELMREFNLNDNNSLAVKRVEGDANSKTSQSRMDELEKKKKDVNYQLLLFKMIYKQDPRLLKYLILYTMSGFLLAPLSFLFISINQLCDQIDCNFSLLAGYILISQATVETFSFLLVPWIRKNIGIVSTFTIGLAVMSLRYLFYAFFFYNGSFGPYSSLITEWGHGIFYGISCTILAETALMISNQSREFIPQLRAQGLLTEARKDNQAQVEEEEENIKVALRATMQATFGGCMDGLGFAIGQLLCGVLTDNYSYELLWILYMGISLATMIFYLLCEIPCCQWSDKYWTRKTKQSILTIPIITSLHGLKSDQKIQGLETSIEKRT